VSWRFLDHTADVGAEIEAPSLGALFAEAAAAFTDTVTVHDGVAAVAMRHLEVAADGLEELMVDWLGELLFLFESEGLLIAEADVEIEERRGGPRPAWHLAATLRGEPYDPDEHPVKVLVKGITYHQLAVEEREGGWIARVIFDI
jgi:SHS2 domain-containing protein